MSEHYEVKFLSPTGEPIYGIVRGKHDEASGQLMVDDAVLPKVYSVLESDIHDIKVGEWHDGGFDDEFHQYVGAEFKKAQILSDSLGVGVKVGKLFGLNVGDGTAWYMVTKVNKKTCKVEWRGFCLDRYTDRWLGWGRSVPIQDIEHYCMDTLQALFGKPGNFEACS